MKFRKDFVTNSSSSSFVCEICGRDEAGFDLSLEDAEMFECVNSHVLCQEHMLNPSREELINEILKNKYWNSETREYDISYTREELDVLSDDELFDILLGEEHYYEVPECLCPICQFEEYSSYDMASYLLTQYKVPKDEVFAEIKKQNKRRRKLYDYEYIAYVVEKFGLKLGDIQASWKKEYKTYNEFQKTLERF